MRLVGRRATRASSLSRGDWPSRHRPDLQPALCGVDIAEDEAFPVGAAFPQCRQRATAVADVAVERVEAPQQRRGVGEAEAERALRGVHPPVIERQCRIVLPEFEVEQRLVPPDMDLVQWPGVDHSVSRAIMHRRPSSGRPVISITCATV